MIEKPWTVKWLHTDVLVIGGGAAGCNAAVTLKEMDEELDVLVVEKAHIERSGCLAAGINALNAYLNPGETPGSFTEYVKREFSGLVREDLVYSIAQGLNEAAGRLERWGVPFVKDGAGRYLARGKRSIWIMGEKIKPLMARALVSSGARVLNRVYVTNYLVKEGRVIGAYGCSVREPKFYIILAKAVICATGGAAGIYRPNNEGSCRHKLWYPPSNTGAGYAMGIRAGAEMTTFEMRFIALRVKDVISPTGTIAQGFRVKQVNGLGEEYLKNYPHQSTAMRLYATVTENRYGRGPCFLDTTHLDPEASRKLKEAYLNMSPGILLKWADDGVEPHEKPVEISGSEPYVVGGHGQAGYWVDTKRRTSLQGLFAAGDVAGGAPKKYVTGCMVEGMLAAEAAWEAIEAGDLTGPGPEDVPKAVVEKELQRVRAPLETEDGFSADELEERLQKIMDEYAGGISSSYQVHREKLLLARDQLARLQQDLVRAKADDLHQLLRVHEVIDRVYVARVLVEHLLYRRETRWRCYQERIDYPERDDLNWMKFVNSRYNPDTDTVTIIERNHEGLVLHAAINGTTTKHENLEQAGC